MSCVDGSLADNGKRISLKRGATRVSKVPKKLIKPAVAIGQDMLNLAEEFCSP